MMSQRSGFAVLIIRVLAWICFLLLVCIVLAFPQTDLWVSSLFFKTGAGFEVNGLWWERIIYHSMGLLVTIVTLGLLGTWLYNRLWHRCLLGLDTPKLSILIGLLVLVPGLLVNWGIKGHIGRARPIQLEQFGGEKRFTPAFVPSDQEGGSFSSGHAATGFWLVAVAFCLSGRFGGIVMTTPSTSCISTRRASRRTHFS